MGASSWTTTSPFDGFLNTDYTIDFSEHESLHNIIYQLRFELETIVTSIDHLRKQRARIQQYLRAHQALTSQCPINILPDEILSQIFMHLTPGTYIHLPTHTIHASDPSFLPFILSAVCRKWRRLVHSSPLMWNRFQVCISDDEIEYADREDILSLLHRSANVDLSVLVTMPDPEIDWSYWFDSSLSHLFSLSKRFTHLTIDFRPTLRSWPLFCASMASLSSLTSLSIPDFSISSHEERDIGGYDVFDTSCPALASIMVGNVHNPRPALRIPWAKLKHIKFERSDPSCAFAILQNAVNVRHLELKRWYISGGPGWDNYGAYSYACGPDNVARMPLLHHLEFEGAEGAPVPGHRTFNCAFIVPRLYFPLLTTLEITNATEVKFKEFSQAFTTSCCKLRTLRISGFHFTRSTRHEPLLCFLEKQCTSLTHLSLRWEVDPESVYPSDLESERPFLDRAQELIYKLECHLDSNLSIPLICPTLQTLELSGFDLKTSSAHITRMLRSRCAAERSTLRYARLEFLPRRKSSRWKPETGEELFNFWLVVQSDLEEIEREYRQVRIHTQLLPHPQST